MTKRNEIWTVRELINELNRLVIIDELDEDSPVRALHAHVDTEGWPIDLVLIGKTLYI